MEVTVIFLFFYASLLAGSATSSSALVIERVHVLTMDGDQVIRNQDVLIEGDRIAAIVPHGSQAFAEDVVRIAGNGQFLMPGLIDAHAHFPRDEAGDWPLADYFQMQLASGVTGLRSMRGAPGDVRLREEYLGSSPRLWLTAPPLRGDEVADYHALFKGYKEEGFDLLKILGGYDRGQFDVISAAAKEAGLPIAGHLLSDLALKDLPGTAQNGVEHLGRLIRLFQEHGESGLRDTARVLAANQIFVCPTMDWYVLYRKARAGEDLSGLKGMDQVPPAVLEYWQGFVAEQKEKRECEGEAFTAELTKMREHADMSLGVLKVLAEERVPLLVSPSAGYFVIPGHGFMREIDLFAEAGLHPGTILNAATAEVGRYFSEPVGMVRPGYFADLILMPRNPLEDLSALEGLSMVMVGGKVMKKVDDAVKSASRN